MRNAHVQGTFQNLKILSAKKNSPNPLPRSYFVHVLNAKNTKKQPDYLSNPVEKDTYRELLNVCWFFRWNEKNSRARQEREKKSYDMLSRDTSSNRFPSKRCVLTSRVSLERGTYTHIKIIPTANFHALTVINEGLILLRGINTINFALSCQRWVTIDVKHWRCNYVLLISVVWNIRPFFLFFTKHNNPVLSLSFFRCLCNQR